MYIKCNICGYETNYDEIIKKHILKKHNITGIVNINLNYRYIYNNIEKKQNIYECSICGFRTKRLYSLNRHIKESHSNYNYTIECTICKKNIYSKFLIRHYKNHGISLFNNYELFKQYINNIRNLRQTIITEKLLYDIFISKPTLKETDYICNCFNTFITIVEKMKSIEEDDFYIFKNKYFPLRLKNKNDCKNKLLFISAFKDENIGEEYYKKYIATKNPFYNHGGKLSPFSEKYKFYSKIDPSLTKDLIKRIREKGNITRKESGNNNKNVKYYINRGVSEEEAKKIISKIQTTFSKEICIKKYGEEKGLERWKKRQEKWLNTLNSKPKDEILRINALKGKNSGYSISKAEKEIISILGLHENNSQVCISPERTFIYDIVVNNKIIEYNGDFWHCNPNISRFHKMFYNKRSKKFAYEIWERDVIKRKFAEKMGYKIMTIWESEYRNNKLNVLEKLKKFYIWIINLLIVVI